MAESNENILFRKSALNRIASADDLDKALSVSNPAIWMSIAAFLAFGIGLVIWAAFAVVPVTATSVGLTDGTQSATCWVDASGNRLQLAQRSVAEARTSS